MDKLNQDLQVEFEFTNKHGLHTRPGAVLVGIAKKFTCDITITNLTTQGKPANAKSLMKLMVSSIKCGHRILIQFQGPDAQVAMEAIMEGLQSGLGE
jgi:Phosphotransferase System HPr (HPr) Family